MKILTISRLISCFLVLMLSPVRGQAKVPSGTFSKVAFIVTVPGPNNISPSIQQVTAEADAIALELNHAGYLVVKYPVLKNGVPQFDFSDELKFVAQAASPSSPNGDQPGDVTLIYYFGHGAHSQDGEELPIPDSDGNDETVSKIIGNLTDGHKSRAVLVFINACRCDAADPTCFAAKDTTSVVPKITTASNAVHLSKVYLSEKVDTDIDDLDHDSVLQFRATTLGDASIQNLDQEIRTTNPDAEMSGLDTAMCGGFLSKSEIQKLSNLPAGQDKINEEIEAVNAAISPSTTANISPFGAAFLLAIRKPNQSLWNVSSNIAANMACFVGGSVQTLSFSTEIPLHMLPYYYFATANPDIDNRN